MSPSMVTALKVSSTPSRSSALSTAGAIGASVKMNDSIVPMSGAIMPAPLAMPQIVTAVRFMPTMAAAPFGKVSVVMIALAAECQSPAFASAVRPSMTPPNLVGIERLADHAGRGKEHIGRFAACGFGGDLGGQLGRRLARLARKGIGIAGIDHERARPPALIRSRHQSTGADGHFERVKTPDTAVPSSSSASSTSVRPG